MDSVIGRLRTTVAQGAEAVASRIRRRWTRRADERLIKSTLARWDIGGSRIRGQLGATSAVSWLIEGSDGMYVLRQVQTDQAYLRHQVRVMRHLSSTDFPYEVPGVVNPRDATDFVANQGGHWLLYRFIEGVDAAEPSSPDRARDVGTLVGHFCRVMHGFGPPGGFPLRLFETDEVMHVLSDAAQRNGGRNAGGRLRSELQTRFTVIRDGYLAIPRTEIDDVAALESTTLYNDWHRYNMVARGETICGLVDYDSLTEGPRIVDFQNALGYVLLSRGVPDCELVAAFTAGYRDISPLSAHETHLIHSVMLDRLLWLVADVLREINREGASAREELAAGLVNLAAWLCGNRAEFVRGVNSSPGTR
jgi:Ser/Thr protein kinase RdoA (MazF antagonist)